MKAVLGLMKLAGKNYSIIVSRADFALYLIIKVNGCENIMLYANLHNDKIPCLTHSESLV